MRLLLALLCLSGTAYAGEASLFWEIPALREDGSTLTNLAGFNVYYGCGAEQDYPHKVSGLPPTQTTLDLTGLPEGVLCRFVATAYDSENRESRYSGEATKLIDGEVPGSITRLSVVATESGPPQMALSQVGSATTYDNSGSTWSSQSMSLPTGTAVGDTTIVALTFWANNSDPASNPLGITGATFDNVVNANFDTQSWVYIWVEDWGSTPPSSITVGRTGSGNQFGTATIVTFRGSSTLSYVSATEGSFTDDTTIEVPTVSGTANQGLIGVFSQDDPAGLSSAPGDMTQAAAALQNTESQWIYYKTLTATGSTGAQTVTINTSRGNYGVSILVNGAATGGGGGISIPVAMHHYKQLGNN